jgi:hypothetical protein
MKGKPIDYAIFWWGFGRQALPPGAQFRFVAVEERNPKEEHHSSDVLKPQTDKNNEEKNKDQNG